MPNDKTMLTTPRPAGAHDGERNSRHNDEWRRGESSRAFDRALRCCDTPRHFSQVDRNPSPAPAHFFQNQIKHRKYHFQTFKNCFIGSEGVQWLIKEGLAESATEAIDIGNMLMQAGHIAHVTKDHAFKNERLFYQFKKHFKFHGGVRIPEKVRVQRRPSASWTNFFNTLKTRLGHSADAKEGGSKGHQQPEIVSSLSDALRGLQDMKEGGSDGDVDVSSRESTERTAQELHKLKIAPLDEHNTQLLNCVHPLKWTNPAPTSRYNLVVVGAGAAGLVSAVGAAGVGAKVAIIERNLLGGDCLNVGCVPSKALLKCAKVAAQFRRAAEYGMVVSGPVKVDFPAIMRRMRRLRASIAPHDSAKRLTDANIDVFFGTGAFVSKTQIEVNGRTLEFHRAVIATGGSPFVPDIPGLKSVPFLTNHTVFNLTKLPRVLAVVGTGPIGCELAQAFARFGSQVHMFLRGDDILRKEEPEARAAVRASLEADGVVFHKRTVYKSVRLAPESKSQSGADASQGIEIHTTGSDKKDAKLVVSALLVAAGRRPNVSSAALEKAGVEYDPIRGITVNDNLRTTNHRVYACGDCASKYQFTHMADFMARAVIKNALFFGRERVSGLLIPWATYTDPEVAHVGLYARDLDEAKIPFDEFKKEFQDNDRCIVDGDTVGYVKILCKKGSDEILGATVVGSHAGNMISEITVAMQNKVGLASVSKVIHPYPTAAEAIRQCGDLYNRTKLTKNAARVLRAVLKFRRS